MGVNIRLYGSPQMWIIRLSVNRKTG